MFRSCVKIQSDMRERANVHRNKKLFNSEMLTMILARPGKVAYAGEQCLRLDHLNQAKYINLKFQ